MLTAKRLALLLLASNAIFFLWAESRRQIEPRVSPKGVIAPAEWKVILVSVERSPPDGKSCQQGW